MAKLKKMNIFGPRVMVLESPFNNIRDEVREHPFSRFFRHLPWFDYTITEPMFENNLRFESDKHIATFPQPIMILHAEDDIVVPYKLGHMVNNIYFMKHIFFLLQSKNNCVMKIFSFFSVVYVCIGEATKSMGSS